jgi:DNA mismatch repair protein MutS
LRRKVKKEHTRIQRTADYLGQLDCLFCFAYIAEKNDYTRPQFNKDGRIFIRQGRHPVVEQMITGERFVPNTLQMDNDDRQILIITGPNMAGKSTVLRQVALTVIMAQMGSFVPAREACISITDKIFTRVGALDNLSSGHSTFMVEMQETANILNNATGHSLVVMDEIGRGTSTFDGLSIAWAVAEYLHDLDGQGVKTLFATHYHELTEMAHIKQRIKNYNIAVKEWNDEIIFLRKLVAGGTNRSYGIQVARLAGIPESVIKQAKKMLARIESGASFPVGGIPESINSDNQKNRQTQLALFERTESRVLKELRRLELNALTPLDALNYLSELKERINTDLDTK